MNSYKSMEIKLMLRHLDRFVQNINARRVQERQVVTLNLDRNYVCGVDEANRSSHFERNPKRPPTIGRW